MFTPSKLLDIAIAQQAVVDANPQTPGTSNDVNYQARKLRDKALAAGEWMERNGHAALDHVGDFSTFKLNNGQTVRLRKGAVIHSTNPQVPREGQINKLNRKIRIHHVICGFTDYCGMVADRDEPIRNPSVNWSGTGSYWYWTDANNVEVVEA